MQLERKIFRPAQFRKFALSALLVPIVLASLLLAVSQSLHEKLHPDATKASHQCSATLLSQHQILASQPEAILVKENLGFVLAIADAGAPIFSSGDYRIAASRAPPASALL